MNCPWCGFPNPEDSRFCSGCGVRAVGDQVKPKLSIKAVAIGLSVDILGTYISSFILGMVLFIGFTILGTKTGVIEEEMVRNPVIIGFFMLNGAFFTLLGGYCSARIARGWELKHSLFTGISSLVFSILFNLLELYMTHKTGSTTIPFALELIGYLITIPLAVLGGYIQLINKKKA